MKLFIDDLRKNPDKESFNEARTYEEAIFMLKYIKFDFITTDYDLGKNQPTGLEILKWMVENEKYPEHINIHSDHTEGKIKMLNFIKENFPENITITTNTL